MEAYSIVGQTMDLYVVAWTCLLQSLKLRMRNQSVCEALTEMLRGCASPIEGHR